MENLIQVFVQKAELALAMPLNQKNLLAFPVTVNAEPSYPINAGDVTFTIGAGAALEVQLFNDEDDIDADKLLASKDAPITFNTANQAYLKYTNSLTAKANGTISLTDIGFSFKSSLDLKSIFYKMHFNADGIKDAFLFDIQHFKTIFNFYDVENLEINDALCFKAAATVKSNLNISWPNILSQSLGSLTKYFPLFTLDIKLSSSLFAKFDFSLTDEFNYFIKKTDAGTCLVSLNKTKTTSLDFFTGFKVEVGFSNPTELNGQINTLFDLVCQSVFGFTGTDIDNAIARTKLGSASSIQKTIIIKVMACLKMDAAINDIIALAIKWEAIEDDIQTTFKKIALTHAQLAFTYEYSFIEENKELLSITVPTETLKNYHNNLLRFNTSNLLNDIRSGNKSIILNSYLNQKTIDIKKNWGFGFSLFGFVLLGKDLADIKTITQSNINNNRIKVTIDCSRGYNWKLGKGSGKWLGEVVAKMPNFSNYDTPILNEFGYSLQLNTALTDPNVKPNDFKEYLDTAVLWGAVNQIDVEKIFNKYKNEIIGKSIIVESKLIFSELATQALINKIGGNAWGDVNKQNLGKAMAGAMKYLCDVPLRATVIDRENTYTALWQNYMADPTQELPDLATLAANTIENLPNNNNLSNHEQNDWNNFDYYFASIIKMNPNIFDSLHDLILGFIDLKTKIGSGAQYTNFAASFNRIKGMFTQSFYIRTLGAFLLHYINDADLYNEVKSVLTISYGTGTDEQVINFSIV